MNKNILPLTLIVLAVGTYFTFTRVKYDEIKSIKEVNAVYDQALSNSKKLINERKTVVDNYNKIDIVDRENLEKMLPDNIDNIRLIIDINSVAAKHGLILKGIKTSAPGMIGDTSAGSDATHNSNTQSAQSADSKYNTMTLNFTVSSSYEKFNLFIKDLESSLRIIDISKIALVAKENGVNDYSVELKTYWLK